MHSMIATIAITLYAIGWISLVQSTRKRLDANMLSKGLFAAGILIHIFCAVSTIHNSDGFHFGFFQVASLLAVCMNTLVFISSLRHPLFKLFLLLIPISVLAIAGAALVTSKPTPDPHLTLGLVSHILLSILAYSMLTIATLQAILLNYQTTRLKTHHAKAVMGIFPPLQTMESLLFDMVWAGFVLLSLSIGTGIIFIEDLFEQNLSHKTLFSILSWFLYATLLFGRHVLGWRGKFAVRWVIAAFAMLMLAYFGSKFVLEFVLNR